MCLERNEAKAKKEMPKFIIEIERDGYDGDEPADLSEELVWEALREHGFQVKGIESLVEETYEEIMPVVPEETLKAWHSL